ncbi:MAG: carbonic anhydrase [Saprospiraceae bacterium]|nr:carbonic anhydrase [Saprospiraceae bacterium]
MKCGTHKTHASSSNSKHETLTINTPDEAILELKDGNKRFLQNKPINADYKSQIEHTKSDQHPHSLILSCLDSRIPPEIIFDQGIGNIFVARNAGNIEDQNILGSMEFATKVKGTKLIVVMGHNHCGAVKGAVDDVELSHLTQLVNQIKPAIVQNENKKLMLDETSKNSVKRTIDDILKRSPVIEELVKKNQVKIVGAYYNLENGKVTFFD